MWLSFGCTCRYMTKASAGLRQSFRLTCPLCTCTSSHGRLWLWVTASTKWNEICLVFPFTAILPSYAITQNSPYVGDMYPHTCTVHDPCTQFLKCSMRSPKYMYFSTCVKFSCQVLDNRTFHWSRPTSHFCGQLPHNLSVPSRNPWYWCACSKFCVFI